MKRGILFSSLWSECIIWKIKTFSLNFNWLCCFSPSEVCVCVLEKGRLVYMPLDRWPYNDCQCDHSCCVIMSNHPVLWAYINTSPSRNDSSAASRSVMSYSSNRCGKQQCSCSGWMLCKYFHSEWHGLLPYRGLQCVIVSGHVSVCVCVCRGPLLQYAFFSYVNCAVSMRLAAL